MSSSARALIAIVLLAVAANVQAEQSPPILERAPIPDFSKVEIKTTRLADDFYILEAPGGTRQGGTISVLTGPDGVLLVDAQFAPLTERLVAAIRKISDKPIRFLIVRRYLGHADCPPNPPYLSQPSDLSQLFSYHCGR